MTRHCRFSICTHCPTGIPGTNRHRSTIKTRIGQIQTQQGENKHPHPEWIPIARSPAIALVQLQDRAYSWSKLLHELVLLQGRSSWQQFFRQIWSHSAISSNVLFLLLTLDVLDYTASTNALWAPEKMSRRFFFFCCCCLQRNFTRHSGVYLYNMYNMRRYPSACTWHVWRKQHKRLVSGGDSAKNRRPSEHWAQSFHGYPLSLSSVKMADGNDPNISKQSGHADEREFDEIADTLLRNQMLLTALELHTELVEIGCELPRLRDFFSNPGNFERHLPATKESWSSLRKSYYCMLSDIKLLPGYVLSLVLLTSFVAGASSFDRWLERLSTWAHIYMLASLEWFATCSVDCLVYYDNISHCAATKASTLLERFTDELLQTACV